MSKKWTRGITLLLAAVMLLGVLAGCGKKTDESQSGNNKDNTDTPEFVYLPDYVELQEDIGRIGQTYVVGDRLYCISWMTVGKVKELYPEGYEEGGWHFTIDGDDVTATRIGSYAIYDDAVYMKAEAAVATASDVAVPTAEISVIAPAPAPNEEPMPVDTPVEIDKETYERERQEAIDTYVKYDENGELIVPEGYEFYEYDKTEQVLLRMNADGSGVSRLENYTLPDMGENVQVDGNIRCILEDAQGNIWVAENVYAYLNDENGYQDMGEQTFLRQIDESGAEMQRRDLGAVKDSFGEDEYFYISTVTMDADGNVYVLCDTKIFVLDSEDKVAFTVEAENWIDSMVRLGDGRICAAVYEEDGQKLKMIDTTKKAWGESYKASGNFYNCVSGNADYDLFYNDGMNFYGYDVETSEATVIVNWLNADINGDQVNGIAPLADGRIVVMLYNWNSERSNTEMAILSKKPYSVLGDKTILTLACMYDYDIRDKVIEFNKKNDKCRIEVRSYEQYNDYDSEDESQWNAGLTKLNAEIISGNVPDIIVLNSNLPGQQYMAQGLLEDLNPYLDNDPEIKRSDLVESVLDAISFNGGLYQTVSSFNVQTVASPKSVVGDRKGWTVGEMRDVLSRMPAGSDLFQNTTKEDALRTFLYYDSGYIDWETGKCSFNSDNFVELLEYVNTFPTEINWDDPDMKWESEYSRLQQGKLLGSTMYLYDISSYLEMKARLGDDMVIMGYPCEDRNGTLLSVDSGIAMSTKCKDKDAAWQFLRTAFLPQSDNRYYYGGLSINRADLDKMIERATEKRYEKDENGVPVLQPFTTWWESDQDGNEIEIKIMPAEQEEVDAFMEIISSAKKVAENDDTVIDMIMNEAQALFAGQKNARDVANIIQSKMQTYVNEHM